MATAIKQVKEALEFTVDQVSKLKNGHIMVRKGYFYRGGMNADKLKNFVLTKLLENGIVANVIDYGDHWAAFIGGASVARQSHFYVELA